MLEKNYALFALVLLLAAFSCTKEKETQSPESPDEPAASLVFNANCEALTDAGKTKVHLNWSENNLIWNLDDKIAVFEGRNPKAFSSIAKEEGVSAKFSGTGISTSSYYALYPYSSSAVLYELFDMGIIATELPHVQRVDSRGICPDGLIAVAVTNGRTLNFKNVFSLLKFQIVSDDITSVMLEGNDSEILAGTVEIIVKDKEQPSCNPVRGSQTITLLPEGETFPVGQYAFSVLPQTLEKGFKLIFKHKGNEKAAVKTTKGETAQNLPRSAVLDASSCDFEPGGFQYYYISSADELVRWYRDDAHWSSTDKVFLGTDIVCDTVRTWNNYTPVNPFSGTFDGQGHSITSFTVEKSGDANFLTRVTGSVSNIVFGSSSPASSASFVCTAAFGDNYCVGPIGHVDGGSLSNIVSYATSDLSAIGGTYVGGVCALYESSADVSSCSFYGTVSISDSPTQTVRMGGVFGCVRTAGSIENCHNYGSVLVKQMVKSESELAIGGIVGCVETAAPTIKKCTNEGSVQIENTVTGGRRSRLGGIVGWWNNIGGKISECSNSGTISNHAISFSGKQQYLGGIAGQFDTNGPAVTRCVNTGEISNTTLATYQYLGGIVGYSTASVTIGSIYSPCENRGVVTNSGASSNSSSNAQPNIAIGGIAGALYSKPTTVAYCVNQGEVSNSGTLSYGSRAGVNKVTVGGIVAYSSTAGSINHCDNSGPVSNANDTTAVSGASKMSRSYTGGILGYSYGKALTSFSNNINHSDVTVTGSRLFENYAGGIIGYVDGVSTPVSSCHNLGNILNQATRIKADSLSTGAKATAVCLGGCIGKYAGAGTISNCENEGQVTNKGPEYYAGSHMGGIVGNMSGKGTVSACSNSAQIWHNASPTTGSMEYALGGIVGCADAAITVNGNCTNNGYIYRSGGKASLDNNIYAGGIMGRNAAQGTIITACYNEATGDLGGKVRSAATTNGDVYVGGIIAISDKSLTVSDCSNSGVITITSKPNSTAMLGGIIASLSEGSSGAALSSCKNSGLISMAADAGSVRMAGIIADADGSFAVSDCENRGEVNNTSLVTADVRIAGIQASNTSGDANLSRCKNKARIVSHTTGALAYAYAAGVLGYKTGTANTLVQCENYGDILLSGTQTINTAYVGGLYAFSDINACAVTDCKVNCTVKVTTTANHAVMGAVAGYLKAPLIQKTGLGGHVGATAITQENWSDITHIVGSLGGTPSSGINVSGDANTCYYMDSKISGVGINDLQTDNDTNAW